MATSSESSDPDFVQIRKSNNVVCLPRDTHLVSLFSQQVRALRLVRALFNEERLGKGTTVAVVGGGGAGITAAAAAALAGADVTLFEQSHVLMPLQTGCTTRALHPHIHHWPRDPAYRSVSHLPILGWTAGTAHDVAQQIVGQFHEIAAYCKANEDCGSICVQSNTRVTVKPKHSTSKEWGCWKVGCASPEMFAVVIMAVGFGLERTVNQLPRRSYWRVDSLGQPALSGSNQKILISGAGDGALIDILRATITNFDHGSFYDEVLLRLHPLCPTIQEIERQAWEVYRDTLGSSKAEALKEALKAADRVLQTGYCDQHDAIMECLDHPQIELNPQVAIHWIHRPCRYQVTAFPLNRLLVWYICHKLDQRISSSSGEITHVNLPDQRKPHDHRFMVTIARSNGAPKVLADQVVLRHGAEPVLKDALSSAAHEQIDAYVKGTSSSCPHKRKQLIPQLKWRTESPYEFKDQVDAQVKMMRDARESKQDADESETGMPKIEASFFRYEQIPPNIKWWRNTDTDTIVYRMKVKLTRSIGNVQWVTYDLHPESNRLQRTSTVGPPFAQWVNSYADYRIRARLSDGREVSEWLSDALERGEGPENDQDFETRAAIKRIKETDSKFKQIREWSKNLKPPPPVGASHPADYLSAMRVAAECDDRSRSQ